MFEGFLVLRVEGLQGIGVFSLCQNWKSSFLYLHDVLQLQYSSSTTADIRALRYDLGVIVSDYHSTVCGTTFPRAYKALSLLLWGMGNECYLLTWNVGGRYSTCPCFSKPNCIWIQTAYTWLVESPTSVISRILSPFHEIVLDFNAYLVPGKKRWR